MSTEEQKRQADARLQAALDKTGQADPRDLYRTRLRQLRSRDAAAFERALTYYENELVPRVAADGDPVAEWLAYGKMLAELGGPGRVVAVDGSGRARPGTDDATAELLLFLPEHTSDPAMVLQSPADPTPAQSATIQLLVERRRELTPQ
ncbi:MAG: hypothetical protein P8Z36_03245 [Gemmatimonadota bacterium]|jgi:hypothetical protein